MGNHRFRISDMIPNAWFYKLKYMGRSRSHQNSPAAAAAATLASKKKHRPAATATAEPSKAKQPHLARPRKSYYFTRERVPSDGLTNNCSSPTKPNASDAHFQDPPPKSSRKRTSTKAKRSSPRLVSCSVSTGCSCRASLDSVWTKPESSEFTPECSSSPLDSSPEPEPCLVPSPPADEYKLRSDSVLPTDSFDGMVAAWSSSCDCRLNSAANNVVLDVDKKFEKLDGFDAIPELDLPHIVTKPERLNMKESTEPIRLKRSSAKFEETNARGSSLCVKVVKEESITVPRQQRTSASGPRISASSPRVRLRVNSPRIASRKVQPRGRRSVSSSRSLCEGVAVTKSSLNPQRDFRDSMVEMIVENNIRASKDLEELLACFLSLNSDEYHDLIISVFKQIWFDLTNVPTN